MNINKYIENIKKINKNNNKKIGLFFREKQYI